MSLSVTSNLSAEQAGTQNPQSASSSNFGASQTSGGVQPGTASDLLTSPNGTKLSNTPLTSVNLNASPGQAITSTGMAKNNHHVNVPLLCFASLLIIIAAALFWLVGRSVKSTT